MSLWNKILDAINLGGSDTAETDNASVVITNRKSAPVVYDVDKYAFVDVEVGLTDNRIHDIGALRYDDAKLHKCSKRELLDFIEDIDFVCGHNIVHHDAKYLFDGIENKDAKWFLVDTLYMSPLLFPERPYHKLLKDDKLQTDQLNNPVNDCEKARELLFDEIAHWHKLSELRKRIFATLLCGKTEYEGFMRMVGAEKLFIGNVEASANGYKYVVNYDLLSDAVREEYKGKICSNANVSVLAERYPCALAYALSLVGTSDYKSVTPGWVLYNYPEVEYVITLLCKTRCADGCEYCNRVLDASYNLQRFFGYDKFRTYDGEPLQENAVCAAVKRESLLAIFPTGGGKSLTFQLPALMDGLIVHGLTVIISPLQSLMKDQVDNLANRGIADAVTINGLLDPISRSVAIERVQNGDASLLYISPEMLRSKTIEKILLARHVVRFVIDEAHCFSAWGQDFRVDYQYIGKFIKLYEQKKGGGTHIPVSCFTATAKQKVIQDICDYFKRWLGVDLHLYASSASRQNLHYKVIHVDSDDEKYSRLREIVEEEDCPTIVYVSRTKRTKELVARLSRDGISALPYNGKMSADDKIKNQDAFMQDKVRVIVATSAFGMGVDKSDVGLVVHYDISDSLENYVQEAGRAGRDPRLSANCFVLYADNDLDKHFILLNQTKLSISEIQQVWNVVKTMTRVRPRVSCSALEIARQAGWDDSVSDIETRVRTALAALEQSGYIERGNNVPHVYATGITVKNMDEARRRITESALFSEDEVENVVRIIKSLISQRSRSRAQDTEGESRIDYLADILGLHKRDIVSAVERMRQDGILADSKDISVFMQDSSKTERGAHMLLDKFAKLERYILANIPDESLCITYKQLNENAVRDGITSSTEKSIRTLLYFLLIKDYMSKREDVAHNVVVKRKADMESTIKRFERRLSVCRYAIDWLYRTAMGDGDNQLKDGAVHFSIVELFNDIKAESSTLFNDFADLQIEDVEEALLYMSKIGALKLEGGFLVLYNAMNIQRIKDTRLRYKQDDYRMLNEFYKQKIQQIHIVGEYANLMVSDYNAALQYVHDYFGMDYKKFISKYFKGERVTELDRNITPAKYEELFGSLSVRQKEIIDDHESRCVVVAAGPGSGKTRVLVHKLASLLLLEDVKHEQLLMLTFSRSAATEFKQRLMQLIGNAAHFVEIKTFHSYCFDLLGRMGNIEDMQGVEARAAEMIKLGEVEPNRISKTVLVIDEAQDMSRDDYALVLALMAVNEDMRVIAVGDDDQNIFEFRGSNSEFMFKLSKMEGGRLVEMTENYRSSQSVVKVANSFVGKISHRIKHDSIVSMSATGGMVSLVHHKAIYMYQPVADDVCKPRTGTVCVLTQTNEEAVIMLALLHRRGVKAKLIQSLGGFRFCNLAEMRYFLKCLDKGVGSPVIDINLWNVAKEKTYAKYASSKSLVYVKCCLDTFVKTNRTIYYSDFREYVFESSVEDFCNLDETDVVVSTIHKAKGREFDNVFMLVSSMNNVSDEVLRRYYVAMTRAKVSLSIHTNSNVFDGVICDQRIIDNNDYPMPSEIVLQLSHKDVYLGFFKDCKNEILAMCSGDALIYRDCYLSDASTGRTVCKLSQSMREQMAKWMAHGYIVDKARVRFVVAWRPKGAPKEEEEIAVLLPDIMLRLCHQNGTHYIK